MPIRESTKENILSFLMTLRVLLKKPTVFRMAETLRENHIPGEYGKLFFDKKIIIKVGGGSRGVTSYVWAKGLMPTDELAADLIEGYNQIRRSAAANRPIPEPEPTTREKVDNIEAMLKKLLTHFNIK